MYEDIDTSAYLPGVRRPAFQELQADLASYDGVVTWRLDRLARRPADFERFWERCERHGVFLASATEPVDSSSELGIAIVRILVTFAQLESHARSQRLRAKAAEIAASGRPPSRIPAYGHTADWTEVVPTEAALIREAADRYLGGESVDKIAVDFNARGERRRSGERWDGHDFRRLLAAYRMVGYRSHRGVPVAQGTWPAILSRDVHERILTKQAAATARRKPIELSLLAGWLVCSRCGARLNGCAPRGLRPRYACRDCRSSISGPPTDTWIQHHVVWRSMIGARWNESRQRVHPPPLSRDAWSALTREERRTHIARHLRHVIVDPGGGGGGPWRVERLRPVWIDDLPDPPPFEIPIYAAHVAAATDVALVSIPGVAEILGVTRARASSLAYDGSLPVHTMMGKRRLFLRADVEHLAEARSTSAPRDGRDALGQFIGKRSERQASSGAESIGTSA